MSKKPDYELAARRAARKHGINEDIFVAQLKQESGLQQNRTSSAGARDIAQFIPSTAKAYGVTLGDGKASDDLDGAARYMKDNLKRTGGNYSKALSIYNSGKPDGYLSIPETKNYVKIIMGAPRSKSPAASQSTSTTRPARSSRVVVPGTKTQYIQPKTDTDAAIVDSLLNRRKGESLLSAAAAGVASGAYTTPGRTVEGSPEVRLPAAADAPAPRQSSSSGGGEIDKIVREADLIDKAKVKYLWGGGHGARQPRGSKVTPVDCSGAVSRILGINPMVSGAFEKWGKPGEGKQLTIYANAGHILVHVKGRGFWGTSKSNPGGGAGWIPSSAVSKEYLARFTKRHPPGL